MDLQNLIESQPKLNTISMTDGSKDYEMPLDEDRTFSVAELEREFSGVCFLKYIRDDEVELPYIE